MPDINRVSTILSAAGESSSSTFGSSSSSDSLDPETHSADLRPPYDLDNNIFRAAGEGRLTDVESFLKTGGMNGSALSPNVQDEFGYTALHAAASYSHHDIVTLLVKDYGADVNIRDEEGDTPLHVVDNPETARLLIELGADPTLRNDMGHLPIEHAYLDKCMDIVEYLSQFTASFVKYEDDDEEDDDFDYVLEEEMEDDIVETLERQYGVRITQARMTDSEDDEEE